MSSETKNFTVGSLWRTREGKKARIVCTDAESVYSGVYQPIVAVIERGLPLSFALNGRTMATLDNENDLIEPWPTLPEAGEGWRLLEVGDEILHTDEWRSFDDKSWVAYKAHEKDNIGQKWNKVGFLYHRRRITPTVIWAAMPAWAKFVAQDRDGTWMWYQQKPVEGRNSWELNPTYNGLDEDCGEVPKAYSPTFTGSWTQSLVERPEGGR